MRTITPNDAFAKWRCGIFKCGGKGGKPGPCPVEVYHGASSEEPFDGDGAYYFTPHKETAATFVRGQGKVIPASLELKKPLVISSEAMESAAHDGTVEEAKRRGFDGLITADMSDPFAQIVVFHSNQVKRHDK